MKLLNADREILPDAMPILQKQTGNWDGLLNVILYPYAGILGGLRKVIRNAGIVNLQLKFIRFPDLFKRGRVIIRWVAPDTELKEYTNNNIREND